jgi:HlyD family secretion protein
MTRKHLKLFLILFIIAACAIALGSWLGRAKPVKVLVAEVAPGSVQDTVSNTRAGTIKACRRAGVSPSIAGKIDALPVKEGDVVKQGDLLMALWNEDTEAQVKLAKSEAVAAKARATQACVLAEVARREADRQRTLENRNLASEEVVDKSDGEARAQAAACDAAKASSQVSHSQLDVAQAALDKTRLTAPFDGVVAEVNGEIGEIVTPSPVGIPTPPAIDLMDITCLYVSAPIDEVDAPRIKLKMPAKISLDAYSGKVFAGVVRRIAPYVLEVEKQARTVDVEVDFVCQQDCAGMLPGYSADIEIIVAEKTSVLRVPSEAVLEGNSVLVLSDDNVLVARKIKTGLSNWEWTEVSDGLEPGDVVVISVERDGVKDGALAEREADKTANQ